MAANVEIRPCTQDDLAEVAALFERWEQEGAVWGLRAEPVERLRERLSEFFLVAREGGCVAGFAIAKLDTERFCIFPDGKPYIEIEDVYVAPEFRSKGVGTALLESLIAAGSAKRVAGFHIYSASKHPARSMTFYERFGFRTWAFQMFRK